MTTLQPNASPQSTTSNSVSADERGRLSPVILGEAKDLLLVLRSDSDEGSARPLCQNRAGQSLCQIPTSLDGHAGIESKPGAEHAQLLSERLGDRANLHSAFGVGRQHEELPSTAIGFEIDARNQRVTEEKWQHVITPTPLRPRDVDLDPIVEPEQPLGAWTVPDEGIERREDGLHGNGRGLGRRIQECYIPPALDAHLTEHPLARQLGEASARATQGQTIIVGEIGGGADA